MILKVVTVILAAVALILSVYDMLLKKKTSIDRRITLSSTRVAFIAVAMTLTCVRAMMAIFTFTSANVYVLPGILLMCWLISEVAFLSMRVNKKVATNNLG